LPHSVAANRVPIKSVEEMTTLSLKDALQYPDCWQFIGH